jgi:hypothetical protein
LDPALPVESLLSLRQLAFSAHSGFLTFEEAARGASYINGCGDLFDSNATPQQLFQLAEALSEILKARFASARELGLSDEEPEHSASDL